MIDYRVIEMQYSSSIAAAQDGIKLNNIHDSFMESISGFVLPEVVANTGMQVVYQNDPPFIFVHGMHIVLRFDHAWIEKVVGRKELCGRVRFVRLDDFETDRETIFSLLFDSRGNAQIGTEYTSFVYSLVGSEQNVHDSLHQIYVGLLNAVHAQMDTVTASR